MDKIKTYTVGLINGFESAFKKLDKLVAEDTDLKDINIKSVEDRYFIVAGRTKSSAIPLDEECLSRIIIYREK